MTEISRPQTIGWSLILLALMPVFGSVGLAAAPTTSASGPTFTYDVPSYARVDVRNVEDAEAGPERPGLARKASASPPSSARGTSAPRSISFIATNTAPNVTEPMIRDAMENATLQTQQGAVSLPKVQSAVDQLAAGSPAPPIKVDGSIIVEGNHRYIAGQIMGQPPAVQPWSGGNPARVIPWWKQVIDPTDWDG